MSTEYRVRLMPPSLRHLGKWGAFAGSRYVSGTSASRPRYSKGWLRLIINGGHGITYIDYRSKWRRVTKVPS